ncbi:type IV secretory system conjugative DNA transfer family protein [Allosediminivita pacifica]|uniref:Type IV secretory pathway TraG/TraD family ATPase VirD4 n=1 Tax=Allosediminivita pacifica TaxID=1267769 RepID=A0A2T6A2U6_9RHOB|nr:type IV secretory system conjugative DNA transfer family protein [Allosediminivita pacifica]PTX38115.1 type IV secretory pathway TraG/TraD family ATPase VirD4 [Allosediminivita pacifica]GGB29486.1 hypothetical protein GCM10011324_43800 [Allosediminivita pacifica]
MSNHGAARWASTSDLRKTGMLDPGGVYLGGTYENPDQGIYYHGDGHVLTVAPPGSGKTAAVAVPNLLQNPSSMVVTDPKGALTAQTAKARRAMGQRVIVLNPWREELTQGLGRDLGDAGFNPLSVLRAGDPAVIDNAEMIATALCPTPPNVNDPSWTQRGASVLTACLLYLTHAPGETATLPRLYSLVRDTAQGWRDLAAKMLEVESFDLSDYAAEILSPLESPRQWAGIEQAMQNATAIYNPQKPLAAHVSSGDFDPAILKSERVTVYLVIPSNRREANKAWLALVMALCAEAVGRAGKAVPVTLLAEEFANLGYMPTISRAMAEYREAGLRAHLVIQNPHQLTRLYGRDGMQEIVNLCAVRQFFGVDDIETARLIEATVGTFTAESRSTSTPDNLLQGGSVNTSEMGVPLIRAQDLLNMPEQEQVILARGSVPPIRAFVKPFFTDQAMLNATDPNPYRDEPQERQAAPFETGQLRHQVAQFADEATGGHFEELVALVMGGGVLAFIGGMSFGWGMTPLFIYAVAVVCGAGGWFGTAAIFKLAGQSRSTAEIAFWLSIPVLIVCFVLAAYIERDNPNGGTLLDLLYTWGVLSAFPLLALWALRKKLSHLQTKQPPPASRMPHKSDDER